MEAEFKKLLVSFQRISTIHKSKSTEFYLDLADKIDDILSNYKGDFIGVSLTSVVKECIQSSVNLLQAVSTSSIRIPSKLTRKLLSLLTSLTVSEPCLQHLISQYRILHLLSTLLFVTDKEGSVIQILKLLSALTFKPTPDVHVREMEPVLKICNGNLLSASSDTDLLFLSLEVLVNLYRDNVPAQAWAKSQDQYDSLQKRLMMLLSNKSVSVILASFHLLAVLSLKEKLGEKIFKPSNLQQTLQLITSVVSTSNDLSVLRNAIGLTRLLMDNCESFNSVLKGYSQLNVYIIKILKQLNQVTAVISAKILEFLFVLCGYPDVADTHITSSLFALNSLEDAASISKVGGVLDLIAETDLIFSEACTWGFRLIQRLIQSTQCTQILVQSTGHNSLLKLVTTCISSFTYPSPYDTEGDEVIRLILKRINSSLSLLHSIAKSPILSQRLPQDWLDPTCLFNLINDQIRYNAILNGCTHTPEWSFLGLHVALLSLHLILLCCQHSKKLSKEYFQDTKILILLSHVIKSKDPFYVNHALHVLNHLFISNSQSFESISEVFVATGSPCDPALIGSSTGPVTIDYCSKMKDITNTSHEDKEDRSAMDEVLEKFKSGLEICDIKTSEIMKVYENKLQMMATHENHLQDMLDAKTVALSQADRLLSQYKGKMTASDLELVKIRSFMQETEKDCERLRDQRVVYQRKERDMEEMINQLQSKITNFTEQHQILTHSFQEQAAKLEVAEQNVFNLQTVKSELETLTSELQGQNVILGQSVVRCESDMNNLKQELIEKQECLERVQGNCKELNVIIQSKDSQLLGLQEARETLERNLVKLTNDLSASENQNMSLVHQQKSLQSEINELQKSLNQLQLQLSSLNTQVKSLEDTKGKLEKRTCDLSKALSDSEIKNKNLSQQQSVLLNEKTALLKKANHLESEVKRLNYNVSELSQARQDLENQVANLSKTLKESESKNKQLLNQRDILENKNAGLQQSLHQLESKIKVLEEEKESLSKTVHLFSAVKDLISKGEPS